MKTGIIVTVTLACLIGCTLLFYAGWELIIVGVLCVLFAFLYTTGPYPLSYNGWGDVLVIIFFGFVPDRWNLLCASANMDAGCYRSLTRLRTAH